MKQSAEAEPLRFFLEAPALYESFVEILRRFPL